MSIVNTIFDIVFVINLVDDKFKREMMTKKLNDLNINFTLINAINGYNEPVLTKYNSYKSKPFDWKGAHPYEINRKKKMIPSAGAYGYLESWLKIIITSKHKKYKKILVFDDDVIFDKNFEFKVRNFFGSISKTFKVAALGVSQHNWSKIVYHKNYYNPIEYTDGSFALGIDYSIFDELITEIRKYNIAFDSGPIRYIYKKYKSECFIAYPNLVIADVTTSSISGPRNMIEMSSKLKWEINNFNYIRFSNFKVSVIIPVYNASSTIKLSLESILNQTYNNLEIIIIDDASTDNSLEIIYSCIKNKEKIKVIELKENKGCYFAKNVGIRLSTGELICFQDADDISLNNRIEMQVKEIIEHNYDMVGVNIIRCNSNINSLDNLNNTLNHEINKYKIKPRLGLITLMYRKKIFEKYGYFNDYYHHSMDQELIDRIYFKNNNKLSKDHTHELLNTNNFKNYKKIDDILYICQPLNDKNISCKFKRGHKKYIRKLYLDAIDKPINYIFPFKLVNYIMDNFSKVIVNDANELNFLKYFTKKSNSKILEINPICYTSNTILITKLEYYNFNKLNKNILTTNGIISNKLDVKYFKINYNYSEYINNIKNEQLEIQNESSNSNIDNISNEDKTISNVSYDQSNETNKDDETNKNTKNEENGNNDENNLENFIHKNNIDQIICSKSIKNYQKIFKTVCNFKYDSLDNNTIFYGVYNLEDFKNIKNHKGNKWVMFAGNDCNTDNLRRVRALKNLRNYNILKYLCIDSRLNNYLQKLNFDYIYLKNNLGYNNLLNKYLDENNIYQVVVSDEINTFNKFKNNYKYLNNYKNTLFCGIYTINDFYRIEKHKGKSWILVTGNDSNIGNTKKFNHILKLIQLNPEKIICINEYVNKNLKKFKIDHSYFNDKENKIEDFKNANIKIEIDLENNSRKTNNFFKNIPIYVLNLKRRLDKLNFMKFKLNNIGIYDYEIFEAVDGKSSVEAEKLFKNYNKTITDDDYLSKGKKYIEKVSVFAILLSYKNLILNILNKNYLDEQYVIIFEDDITFKDDILGCKITYDKDVIYLGANQLRWNKNVKIDDNYELSDNCNFITYGAFAIIYKVKFLKIFYNFLINNFRRPYDYILWNFIVKNKISNKVLFPNLVIPDINESDNMGNRELFKISKRKKWDITLYKFQILQASYYKFYSDAFNYKSFRIIDNSCDGIHYKDISRIIEGKNKAFVFVIPSYNNQDYYLKNLNSILKQTYKLWRIIYIDDNSTDNTYNLVKKYISEKNLKNVTLIKNEQNMKQAYNRFQAFKLCDDDEVICFLDGDDWLYNNTVLEKLNIEYQSDIKLTYGSYYKFENGKNTSFEKSRRYSNEVINKNLYRQAKGWYGIPLRTGYAYLYKSIPKSYLLDNNGKWMSACTDVAEFLWGIERCNGKFKYINYPTYVYNIDASKRFSNSMYNLSRKQLQYRINTSEKIFNYN